MGRIALFEYLNLVPKAIGEKPLYDSIAVAVAARYAAGLDAGFEKGLAILPSFNSLSFGSTSRELYDQRQESHAPKHQNRDQDSLRLARSHFAAEMR